MEIRNIKEVNHCDSTEWHGLGLQFNFLYRDDPTHLTAL